MPNDLAGEVPAHRGINLKEGEATKRIKVMLRNGWKFDASLNLAIWALPICIDCDWSVTGPWIGIQILCFTFTFNQW